MKIKFKATVDDVKQWTTKNENGKTTPNAIVTYSAREIDEQGKPRVKRLNIYTNNDVLAEIIEQYQLGIEVDVVCDLEFSGSKLNLTLIDSEVAA